MTDKRLVVTGIVALVFTVPVLVQPLRDGICIGAAFALFAAGLIVYGLFKG